MTHMPELTHILLFKSVTLDLVDEFGHDSDPKLLKKLTRNRIGILQSHFDDNLRFAEVGTYSSAVRALHVFHNL